MDIIEICLYLFAQGTPKLAGVLMIRRQNRSLVFALTGNASVEIQPVVLNEGIMLKNESCSSLRSSVQRRGAVPLFRLSEQRLWLGYRYATTLGKPPGAIAIAPFCFTSSASVRKQAVKFRIPPSRHQAAKPTRLTLTNLYVDWGL